MTLPDREESIWGCTQPIDWARIETTVDEPQTEDLDYCTQPRGWVRIEIQSELVAIIVISRLHPTKRLGED